VRKVKRRETKKPPWKHSKKLNGQIERKKERNKVKEEERHKQTNNGENEEEYGKR
jgi:hypothetical protein